MDNLLLHQQTREHVAQFMQHPAHAVLLVGNNGIGKTHLALSVAAQLLELEQHKLLAHPYFRQVSPEKDTISIEQIRELQRFLQLKTIGNQPIRRIVLLEHVEGLTVEAQNAYLKLLEEPPADTVMLLTVDNQRALLPTILSRVQSIPVYVPVEEDVRNYFASLATDTTALNQAYFLSGGLPGLMSALVTGDETHPLLAGVADAKQVLQKQVFERLAMVEGMSKQKESARYMLEALQHIAQTGLDGAAKKGDAARLKQWHKVLKLATKALDALGKNANPKLVLTDLMLAI